MSSKSNALHVVSTLHEDANLTNMIFGIDRVAQLILYRIALPKTPHRKHDINSNMQLITLKDNSHRQTSKRRILFYVTVSTKVKLVLSYCDMEIT